MPTITGFSEGSRAGLRARKTHAAVWIGGHEQKDARMTVQRRNLIITAAAGLAAPCLVRAQGDAWPDRPLRLVVPWPPGGSTDTVARAFQPRPQELLGRPVAVENRPGMAGAAGVSNRSEGQPRCRAER